MLSFNYLLTKSKIGLLNAVGGSMLGICLGVFITMHEPSAMDVYQGKATLEITYKDGVPVDSVVVFKNKEK